MKFIRVVRYDLCNGFVRNIWKQAFCFALTISFCFCFLISTQDFKMYMDLQGQVPLTSSDVVLFIFGGMIRFDPSNAESFPIPFFWFLANICICYFTLQYPFQDMSNTGIQVMIRCKEKISWWISKCIWNTLTVISSFIVCHLAIIVFCTIAHIPISLDINSDIVMFLFELGSFNKPTPSGLFLFVYFLPMVVCVSINIAQMVLSLVAKPFVAFLCTSAFWLICAYFYSPFLIGNYSMAVRTSIFASGSLHFSIGIVFCILYYVLALLAGVIVIRNKELLLLET